MWGVFTFILLPVACRGALIESVSFQANSLKQSIAPFSFNYLLITKYQGQIIIWNLLNLSLELLKKGTKSKQFQDKKTVISTAQLICKALKQII